MGVAFVPATGAPADDPATPLLPPVAGPGLVGSELQARTVDSPASVAQRVTDAALM